MASLTIGGRVFDIAPYKLGSLRRAAPLIDRINASGASLGTLEGMAEAAADIVAALSIGLVKLDPALTPEALDEMIGFDDLPALQQAFTALLHESGMRPGEVKAPASAPAGASKKRSKTSSTS